MATHNLHIPHDTKTSIAAMAAIILIGAVMIFLMVSLVRNVGAY